MGSKEEQGKRLKHFYKKMGLTQDDLAQLVGAEQTTISMAVTGKRYVQEVWMYKIKEKYNNVNTDWILTGEGEMLIDVPDEKKSSDVLVMEDMTKYSNGRQLKKDEMEKMLARMAFRIEELEEWRREMEEWKKEVMTHLLNTKK